MATCVTCSTEFPESLGACPQCRTPLTDVATVMGESETRMSPATPPPSSSGKTATSATGWLSSSGAIDHGRFPPGTLLGGRYRIVGRLGRGGMGEVYRADDLKLGQPVALKFLPPEVDRDPARLMQLHTEVRMARQVSHPNVCRVYDIDEVEGHAFLSMEYVDGEDLASLLRRIGRFSTDRAIEISRQVCAGLAAAHERGVMHRDLKPANVMLDATGKVRITDFGLAGITGEALRAGTPAYMAPEQLAGGEVTARSDIYALGLVLYELFTGRRALDGKTIAELVRQRDEGTIAPPSELVRDLDPAIDRAIMRCLEREPEARPASALAVAAALPGGDPLAAALAAGETPSPEMVAAAGSSSALGALPAIAALVATIVTLLAIAAMADRNTLTSLIPTNKPPAVLIDRATELAHSLGYTDRPADDACGFGTDASYLEYARTHPEAIDRARLASGRLPALIFWYRTSPRPLVPTGDDRSVTYGDPPHTVSGMVAMQLDTEGRLLELLAVPAQLETAAGPATTPPWNGLFNAAGLDIRQFASAVPTWTPRSHSDARAAWEGPIPGWPEQHIRIEAAAYRGKPVYFQIIWPWTTPTRMTAVPASTKGAWLQTVATILFMAVLVGALLVARHNLRERRGDRRGARLIATTVLLGTLGAFEIGGSHVPVLNTEIGRLFTGLGNALWAASTIWVLYIALEPYVRRFWPTTLIAWSRMMAGQLRDPLVGRDVLIGCLFAGGIQALGDAFVVLVGPALGYAAQPSVPSHLAELNGIRQLVAGYGAIVFNALLNALWLTFGLVVLKLILRRVWVTSGVALVFFILVTTAGQSATIPWWVTLPLSVISISLILLLMLRFGLLATSVFFFVNFMVGQGVLTLQPGRWFFATSTWTLTAAAAIAAYGFYAARGGEPLMGRRLLD